MKMKKLDLNGLKKFMLQKGERVGLAVCALIAVLVLGVGFMKAGGSSTPYAENFKRIHEGWDRTLHMSAGKQENVAPPKALEPWEPINPDFEWVEMMPSPDASDTKRRQPKIVKILDDPGHIHVDVVIGGYFANQLGKGGVSAFDTGAGRALGRPQRVGPIGATAGEKNLVKIMKPGHMVIVTAVFPMREQLKEYQRQLHYATMNDLLEKDQDLPRALGLTVFRREIKADGTGKWEEPPVYHYDAKEDKAVATDRIDKFFREALIDVDNIKSIEAYAHHGMMTPIPELATPYSNAKLELQDIKVEDIEPKAREFGTGQPPRRSPSGVMPLRHGNRANQADDDTPSTIEIPWKDLGPETAAKFKGELDYFDYKGQVKLPDDQQKATTTAPRQRYIRKRAGAASATGPGRSPANANFNYEIFDSLVRFVDVGVQPGKTYQYSFCVHMANPNYEQKDIAFQQLAKDKELISPFSFSPPVTIPNEYYYYAADEQINNRIQGGSDWQAAKAEPPLPYGKWNTAVQVHIWKGMKVPNTKFTMADWAIAERLLIHRGEPVGRNQVIVEVPVWDPDHTSFEIGSEKQNAKKRNQRQENTGIPISFLSDLETPLLVDFEGGKKSQVKIGAAVIARDESAVDLLVMTPDGKLLVRNSRDDSDTATRAGAERLERVHKWKQKLRSLQAGAAGNSPPNGNAPGYGGRRN